MLRRRGPAQSRPVLPATGIIPGAGTTSKPTLRSSARLRQQEPIQYFNQLAGLSSDVDTSSQLPPPIPSQPPKRKATKAQAQGPPPKKPKTTASKSKGSLVIVLRFPRLFTRFRKIFLDNPEVTQETPAPILSSDSELSEPPTPPSSPRVHALAATRVYRGTFVPKQAKSKRGRPAGVSAVSVLPKKPRKDDDRPDPCGTAPAWSADRPGLAETFWWFRVTQGGGYFHDNLGYGWMANGDSGDRRHMDSEILITRAGGGGNQEDQDGITRQTKHHDRTKAPISGFIRSMEQHVPIGMVAGKDGPCPSKLPRPYSVLDWFHLVTVWAEKKDGKICIKYRFEKIFLEKKSWWAPVGSADPPTNRDYETKALRKSCTTCHQKSPQVYSDGWICLNEHCEKFWTLKGAEAPSQMEFNPAFINERTLYADKDGVPDLLPRFPDPVADAWISTKKNSWKGLVCPNCLACTARAHWNAWRCETEGCNFVLPVKHTLRNYHSLLADHQVEETGRALALDKWATPIQAPKTELLGYWRIQTFEIPGLGTVTHYQSNAHINRKAGGAHQILEDLQKAELDLCRNKMDQSVVDGTRTAHFTRDFGMLYKYVVSQDNTALKDAPAVIQNALGRMTWAGRHHANGADFLPYNEVLALGYFEQGKIGFHDDGEDSLAGTIATMSIGCNAEMLLRFKAKYHFAPAKDNYDPAAPLYEGFQAYEARLNLNTLHNDGKMEEYEAAKVQYLKDLKALKFGRGGKTPPNCLQLMLKHGDMVVMSGELLQKLTEHSVIPNGDMRFALTARYIKPEKVPQALHWKGQFTIPDNFVYTGDINLPAETQATKVPPVMAPVIPAETTNGRDGEEI